MAEEPQPAKEDDVHHIRPISVRLVRFSIPMLIAILKSNFNDQSLDMLAPTLSIRLLFNSFHFNFITSYVNTIQGSTKINRN